MILLAFLAFLSTATAAITCALPAGGIYKAGDGVILDWGSDGTAPVVKDIISVSGSLYCNTGVLIAQFPIPVLTGSYNWTLPSVGNATTVGGTAGTCTGNAFHMEYSGVAMGFLNITRIPWGPVQCGTITILPAPNGTITTTTTTMSSTSTTASITPTVTDTPGSNSGGGLSTTIVVVIAVVAAVLVTLSMVAIVVCCRRRRRQRKLDNALMPWNTTHTNNNHIPSTTNNNGFSKITSSVDDEPRSHDDIGSGSGSGSGNAGGGDKASVVSAAAAAFALKAQPTVPQPSQNQYYGDEGDYANYGYQQQQQLLQQQQQQQQHYNEEEDAYYNPYYASGGMGPTTAAVVNQSNPSSFYDHYSGGGLNGGPGGAGGSHMRLSYVPDVYQNSPDMYQMQQQRGFYPPPPVGLMTSSPNAPNANINYMTRNPAPATGAGSGGSGQESNSFGYALTSLPTTNSSDSSPRRGPQVVMAEMGRREAEKAEKEEKAAKAAKAETEGASAAEAEVGNEKVPVRKETESS
ncbi:hypothetical protein EC991_007453 [Linnemannia zychae]|nr:hypothetical protein EC991_007453 [Linnemannia zychae]